MFDMRTCTEINEVTNFIDTCHLVRSYFRLNQFSFVLIVLKYIKCLFSDTVYSLKLVLRFDNLLYVRLQSVVV